MGAIALEPDADDLRLRAGLDELARAGVLRPVSDDPHEIGLFCDCDLASLVENRLLESVDPRDFSETARRDYRARVALRLTNPRENAWCASAYFLLQDGELAGTITLGNRYLGSSLVSVSHLYVLPEYRRREIARRTLESCRQTLAAHGAAGLQVSTCWTWQPAVRFYLGLRMWLESWSDELVFVWRDPRQSWSVELVDDSARFCVLKDGEPELSLSARRNHDRLELAAPALAEATEAVQTFAVVLAVNGWPLIRSERAWAERRVSSERGAPEGLAYKLEIFEALERRAGLEIRTPRIPGIAYRDYDAID